MESNQLFKGIKNDLIPDYIYNRLPDYFQKILLNYYKREKDVLLTASIVAISSVLPNMIFYYDRRKFFPNLYGMISAPAASGKGVMNKARNLVSPIHKELIQTSLEDIRKWKKDQKDGKQVGLSPQLKVKILAGNISSAELYAYLNSSEHGLLMMESEADIIGNMLTNDWSSYSPILRNAFQNEPISMVRKMDKLFVEIEEPVLSLLLSGTPDQFKNIIKSRENGLFSRFLVYAFDEVSPFRDVYEFEDDEDPDKNIQEVSSELLNIYRKLNDLEKPIVFKLQTNQQRRLIKLFTKIQRDILENHPNGFSAHIMRYALMFNKIALVLSVMRQHSRLDGTSSLICTHEDYLIAERLIKTYIKHALIVYYSFDDSILSDADEQLFFSLHIVFTRKEAIDVGKRFGVPTRTMDEKLSKWKKMKVVHTVGKGKYRKHRDNI